MSVKEKEFKFDGKDYVVRMPNMEQIKEAMDRDWETKNSVS